MDRKCAVRATNLMEATNHASIHFPPKNSTPTLFFLIIIHRHHTLTVVPTVPVHHRFGSLSYCWSKPSQRESDHLHSLYRFDSEFNRERYFLEERIQHHGEISSKTTSQQQQQQQQQKD
jgi:hypothetical protein